MYGRIFIPMTIRPAEETKNAERDKRSTYMTPKNCCGTRKQKGGRLFEEEEVEGSHIPQQGETQGTRRREGEKRKRAIVDG
jgi:hypothetical protein